MSQELKDSNSIVMASPRQYFAERIDEAVKRLKFESLPTSRTYLAELLEHFMFASNLSSQNVTLAELYLKAQSAPPPVRTDLLKKLGDSSLYISGFFGDSLTRKLVDIDYYVDMGGAAYGALAAAAPNEDSSQMFTEYSVRFTGFVDILTYISQNVRVQSNEDLLRLYNRYMVTGSKLAEEALMEKGLLNADIQKSKISKM